MRAPPRLSAPACLVWLLALSLGGGCQRAGRYGAPPVPPTTPAPAPPPATAAAVEPVDPNLIWQDGVPSSASDLPIEFVHAETDPRQWAALPRYWNAPALAQPDRAAALVGLSPLTAAATGALPAAAVKIKVPLGLDDPRPHIPADDPPTLGKWKLGQALFFDTTWLEPGVSCASCHQPREGFADHLRVQRESYNTPTLINCIYNTHQFWDGRAGRLEEVIQGTLGRLHEPDSPAVFRHAWGAAAIRRLQAKSRYNYQFEQVFGTPPTADAVGRAVASFLRTLLSANSVHDRALAAQAARGSPALEASHYEAVLDEAHKEILGREGARTADVARELYAGYRLFYNLGGTHRANCVACHGGRTFSDGGFHNLGRDPEPEPGKETGRFRVVPVGRKDRTLIGAYRTPPLRSLLRTAPYYHDGGVEELADVVRPHAIATRYLDPEMRIGPDRVRGDDLTDEDVQALVLFLRALNGEEVPLFLQNPPPAP